MILRHKYGERFTL